MLRYESIWHIDFTDENYSPISRINFAEWNDQTQLKLLQTVVDLNDAREKGLLITTPAMEGKYIVNCPFFDQQTILQHISKQ